MAWTNKQKQLAARACDAAGITREQRRGMILRNFDRAKDPATGEFTSTSPRLTNADFEQFMAVVEGFAGGTILHFTAGYWTGCAGDALGRMRHRAQGLADALEAAGVFPAGGGGLAGWIARRVARGECDRLEQLDFGGLSALILGLEAFCRQRGVKVERASAAVAAAVHG